MARIWHGKVDRSPQRAEGGPIWTSRPQGRRVRNRSPCDPSALLRAAGHASRGHAVGHKSAWDMSLTITARLQAAGVRRSNTTTITPTMCTMGIVTSSTTATGTSGGSGSSRREGYSGLSRLLWPWIAKRPGCSRPRSPRALRGPVSDQPPALRCHERGLGGPNKPPIAVRAHIPPGPGPCAFVERLSAADRGLRPLPETTSIEAEQGGERQRRR